MTGFHAQIRVKDGNWRNCTIFPTNQSCLFKELQSMTSYEIRIRALNEKGPGGWRTASTKTGIDIIGR